MSTATANAKAQLYLDHIACGREASKAAYSGGTALWDIVDAAADHDFENALKGATLDTVDAALAAGTAWNSSYLTPAFTLLEDYIRGIGVTTPAPLLATYLASYGGWRVPYYAAQSYYEAMNSRLTAIRVFPKGVLVADEADPASAGMHKIGRYSGGALTVTDGALDTTLVGAAAIVAINLAAAQTVGATFTATLQDGTTKDLALSLAGANQYTQTVLGEQAIGAAGAAAGQTVVPVAATAQFKAGEWVLLRAADGSAEEIAQIASLVADTSLTMESDLLNSYAENDLVWPLFTNCIYKSGASGSGNVDLFFRPDRIVAL